MLCLIVVKTSVLIETPKNGKNMKMNKLTGYELTVLASTEEPL